MKRFSMPLIIVLLLALVACGTSSEPSGIAGGTGQAMAQVVAEINAAPTPAGVDEVLYQQLKTALISILEERAAAGKVVSAGPPTAENIYPVVALDTSNTLLWYMENPGDYNQDGEVGISDLTPLGIYFSQRGPFAPESERSIIDGNHDGEINIGDITPIGQNFGNRITEYTVYGSDDEADYPLSEIAKEVPQPTKLGAVAVNSVTPQSGMRKVLSYDATATELKNLWVAPTDGTNEGSVSTVTSGRWHVAGNVLPAGVAGYRASLTRLTDGKLAVAMMDATTNALLYMASTDSSGDTWGAPLEITTEINPDCHPCIFQGDPFVGIGYTYGSDMYQAYSTDAGHAVWNSFKLEPMTEMSSLSAAGKTTSADGKPEIVEIKDLDGITHGFYLENNQLHHVGHRGHGIIRISPDIKQFAVYFDVYSNKISVAFYEGTTLVIGKWDNENGWDWSDCVITNAQLEAWANSAPAVDSSSLFTTVVYTGSDDTVDLAYQPSDAPGAPYEQFALAEMPGDRPQFEIMPGDSGRKPADELVDPRASPLFWLVDEQAFHVLCRNARFADPNQTANVRLFIAFQASLQQHDVFEHSIDIGQSVSNGVVTQVVVHSSKDNENNCALNLFRHED